jgi:hypothetical protein
MNRAGRVSAFHDGGKLTGLYVDALTADEKAANIIWRLWYSCRISDDLATLAKEKGTCWHPPPYGFAARHGFRIFWGSEIHFTTTTGAKMSGKSGEQANLARIAALFGVHRQTVRA